MSEYEAIEDESPASKWIEMDISHHIKAMKMHRRLIVQKMKETGVWSKDEIHDIFRIITKKIRSWEKLQDVDLHHFDACDWLRES